MSQPEPVDLPQRTRKTLIAAPPYRSRRNSSGRCSSRSMMIEKSRYMEATKHIRRYANRLLDPNLTIDEQDPKRWQKFVSKVCRADPIFLDYVDHWPITYYAEEYLLRPRRAQKNASQHNSMPEQSAPIGGEPATYKRIQRPAPRADDCVAATSQRARVSRTETAQVFAAVLDSLSPSIGELCSIFEQHDIRDLDALRVLATFPETRRAVFLRVDMGLTSFQYHKASEALITLVQSSSRRP